VDGGGPERTLATDRHRTIVDVYVLLRRPDGMILQAQLADAARDVAQQLRALDRHAHAATKLRARDKTLAALRAAIDLDLAAAIRDSPALARVMFERPFADFDPGPHDIEAGASVREFIIDRVRRCVDARIIAGDPTDIAHVLIGLALGLSAQETAGWLGGSQASADRRWHLGADVLLHGLSHTAQADEPAPESPER